jgi:hypothetical protein
MDLDVPELGAQRRDAGNVVDVPMRENHRYGIHVPSFQTVDERIGIEPGINDQTIPGGVTVA